jgi:hypothetical protein
MELEGEGLAPLGGLDLLDLVELLDPGLHLGGLGGLGLEPLDETHLLGQHGLLALVGGLGLGLVEGALALVEVVVAGVAGEDPAVDLDDPRDDPVHELAVVRGHQQRPLVRCQEALQPDDRFDVQVVRGLVEEHGVRAHEQDAGQPHPHLPAARESADVAVHHLLREAQPGQDLPGPGLERVTAELVETGLHLSEARQHRVELAGAPRVGQRVLELSQLHAHRGDLARAGHHLGDGGAAGHLAHVLAEVADADAAIDRHLALVGRLLLHDQTKDGGLAGAVGADQAHLFPAVDGRRRLHEQDLGAVLLADLVEPDHEAASLPGKWE